MRGWVDPVVVLPEGSVYAHPSRVRPFSVYKLYIPSKVSEEPRFRVGAFCLRWIVRDMANARGRYPLILLLR